MALKGYKFLMSELTGNNKHQNTTSNTAYFKTQYKVKLHPTSKIS